jgi:hypothetical protein
LAHSQSRFIFKPSTLLLNVFYLVIAFLLVANSSSIKAEEPELPSQTQVLLLIAEYRQDPLSPEGFKAASEIHKFAERSSAVIVELNSQNTPWLETPAIGKSLLSLLVGAYVVGNVEPQLIEKIKRTRHCAGAKEVETVLNKLQLINPTLEVSLAIQLNQKSQMDNNCRLISEPKKLEST